MAILASTAFGLLAKYESGRRFLLKHPRLFTLGTFSHEGPTSQQLAETSFSETFYAQGYSKELRDKHPNPEELRRVQPDVSLVTSVSGPEPGNLSVLSSFAVHTNNTHFSPLYFKRNAGVVCKESSRSLY